MVHLAKLLKLGGFSINFRVLKQEVEHLGFARKEIPPDTPHSENKTRWSVNALGQAVVDTGTPVEITRALYIDAAEKTFEIPELASVRERQQLVEERCDHVRVLCTLAEKGDEPSGEYLLAVLTKDPATEVRETVLSKLMFAARGPKTPYNRKLVEGSAVALSDKVANLRGLATVLQERAARDQDNADVQTQIKPQKRKDVITSRGECTAPGQAQDAGTYSRGKSNGGGAWQEVRDLAMAVQDRDLIHGVVNMMSHPVLPVRIAAWETFGAKDTTSTRGRCREVEALAYQKRVKYEGLEMQMTLIRHEADTCLANIMEENREKISRVIEKENTRAELTASQVEKIVDDFRNELADTDPEYHRLKHNVRRLDNAMADLLEDLEKDLTRYEIIQRDLNNEIMGMIGSLLEEKCAVLESVNKLCGGNGKGNWYVRRCLVRILEPMAVAGGQQAINLIEKCKNDRSPYVRRTVYRSLQAVSLAERKRTALAKLSSDAIEASQPTSAKNQTEEEKAEKDIQDALEGLGSTDDGDQEQHSTEPSLEEKRMALKALRKRQEAAEEEARIKALNVSEFTWQQMVDIIESLRPKFNDRTDIYKKQVRMRKLDGDKIYEMIKQEESLVHGMKMTVRKHRVGLKLHIKHMMEAWHEAVDADKIEQRFQKALQSAARENANNLNALAKERMSGGATIKSAYHFDNYAYGNATGLGSMLHRDDRGSIIFRRVIPCGGIVNDNDTLIKIGSTPVEGLTLVEVKGLFQSAGELAPCLVRLTSEKDRMKAIEENAADLANAALAGAGQSKDSVLKKKKAKNAEFQAPIDLLRTVHITCQPPPFRDEYLESIGLDVEIYQGDATRSLQVMTFLQRNGFSQLLSKCLVDLHVKKLVQLAERYNDDAWIQSVGIKNKAERLKFKKMLERLAFRYGIRDHVPKINQEDTRPDAHKNWVFITGQVNATQQQHCSHYRTSDVSQNISEFRQLGRTPIILTTASGGMEYTMCWNPDLKIAVELTHASSGTLRFAMSSKQKDCTANGPSRANSVEKANDGLLGDFGTFDYFVVFSDGHIESCDRLNAIGLLEELLSQPAVEEFPDDFTNITESGNGLQKSRLSTQQSQLPSISSALQKESINHKASMQPPQGNISILTSGSHLGSPTKWKNGCSRFFEASRPQIGSSDSASMSQREYGKPDNRPRRVPEASERRDRAWYVKGAGRGPSRGYSQQRTFVKEVNKWVDSNSFQDTHSCGSTALEKTRPGVDSIVASGGNMGFFGGKRQLSVDDDDSDAESDIDSDEDEEVVGFHVAPLVGHRVILREKAQKKFPELVKETDNSTGSITWVDPTDADGDGVTGDISEVTWDNGYVGDYRTGFEGTYRLCLDPNEEDVNRRINIGALEDEQVVGLDVEPLEGQRVVLMAAALMESPSLFEDSKGGPGTILWVDPEDADGDGITGDICEVQWDLTNVRADYRTGFEGAFRLALFDPAKAKRQREEQKKKSMKKQSLGRKSLRTIDENRRQAADDPWKFWEEATAVEKHSEDAELKAHPTFQPQDHVPYKLTAQGLRSSLRIGNWSVATQQQNNGTTIEVKYDPVSKLLGDRCRLATDAKRLGLRFTHGSRQSYISTQKQHMTAISPFNPLTLHLTGEGLVLICEDGSQKKDTSVSKTATPPAQGRATFISPEGGLEESDVDEAALMIEGIPRHSIKEILSLKRNEMIETTAGHSSEHDKDHDPAHGNGSSRPSSHSSSRPGSRGYARMCKAAEKPVPQSIRSIQRNAAHERPVTPVTGKAYTALRPSSRGSVRHSLNLEDSFGVGQDMQSRDPLVMLELRSHDGDFLHEKRLSSEANIIIEDDHVR